MITYFNELEQGSDEWLAARCGLLTASTMKLLVTPTLKAADNDKSRIHLYELCAQRITNYIEPAYVSEHMTRGSFDEVEFRQIYNDKLSPVTEVGFITNSKWGFTLGYSPDGLVGSDGLIEGKSRLQKFQLRTIASDVIDPEFMVQLQTGLLVSERKWIDFIQYCGGMPLYVKRVFPDEKIQTAIIEAVKSFEEKAKEIIAQYEKNAVRFLPTERKFYDLEMNVE